MALFTSMFPTQEYNVPYGQIRAPGNQVNISGGQPNDQDAFAAFSRLYAPMLQSQAKTLADNWSAAAQAVGPLKGPQRYKELVAQGGGIDPAKYGQEDLSRSLAGMFQRQQDAKTVGGYFGPQYSRPLF